MSYIFLSPHLDDVILSCGGLINKLVNENNSNVEIWTFASGMPDMTPDTRIVRELLHDWNFLSAREAVQSRIDEDKNAASVLRVKTVYLNFLDCIYRKDENNEYPYDNVFVEPMEFDKQLMEEYLKVLNEKITDEDIVFAPVSIGGHVDHRIVHKVSKRLSKQINYFLDVPYSIWHADEIPAATDEYKVEYIELSDLDFSKWEQSIKEYKSQISTLFDDINYIKKDLQNFCNGGFRIFKK